jgi:two-component system nitrate/nitrite response regulator NarL
MEAVQGMRLILGDDHALFLDALASVLTQHGYDVGAVARSPEEMLALTRHQAPDGCVVDSLDPDTIESAAQSATVVVLSADPDPGAAERALAAGATGYLHQSRGVEVLVAALERVLRGEQVVDVPGGAVRRPRATAADNLAAALTQRERECLTLLVSGLDTPAMMRELGVSRTTVRTHLQAVLSKLCVHSRLEAASFAVRHSLVDAPQPGLTARPAALQAAS